MTGANASCLGEQLRVAFTHGRQLLQRIGLGSFAMVIREAGVSRYNSGQTDDPSVPYCRDKRKGVSGDVLNWVPIMPRGLGL